MFNREINSFSIGLKKTVFALLVLAVALTSVFGCEKDNADDTDATSDITSVVGETTDDTTTEVAETTLPTPPETESPVTEPPVTEPPVTEPPVTEEPNVDKNFVDNDLGPTESVKDTIEMLNAGTVKSININGNSIDKYVIIRPYNASPSEVTASRELKYYIKLACGVDLDIKTDLADESEYEIVIGNTNRKITSQIDVSDLKDEGFIILCSGNKLAINGGKVRGAIYGAYTFLEECVGYMWLSSTLEYLEPSDSIEVKDGYTTKQLSQFEYRDTNLRTTNTYTGAVNASLFRAKSKINGTGNQDMTPDVGSGVFYAKYFVHSLHYWAGNNYESTICYTSDESLDLIVKNIRAELDLNDTERPKTIVSISETDGRSAKCAYNCENCAKLLKDNNNSKMALQVHLANRIAEALENDYPDVKIDALCYWQTLSDAPNIIPHKNVIVRVCSYYQCYTHAYCDCEESSEFYETYTAWAAKCDNIYIWDYATYANTISFTGFRALYKNINDFYNHGVKGIFILGDVNVYDYEFAHLRTYLYTKLYWDPGMSEDTYWNHVDKFLRAYYGAGWQHIRNYIDKLEELGENICVDVMSESHKICEKLNRTVFNQNDAFMIECWDKAAAAAEDESELKRIENSRISYDIFRIYKLQNSKFEYQDEIKKIYDELINNYDGKIRSGGKYLRELTESELKLIRSWYK